MIGAGARLRSEEHTSELQSQFHLVCRLLHENRQAALHAIDDNDRIAQLFATHAYRLLGGTSWLWANDRFRDSVDVLFIDEAGQMSLADVLAVSFLANTPTPHIYTLSLHDPLPI